MSADPKTCEHEWYEFENKYIEGGLVCPKCKSFKGVGQDDSRLIHLPLVEFTEKVEDGIRTGNLEAAMAPAKRYRPEPQETDHAAG